MSRYDESPDKVEYLNRYIKQRHGMWVGLPLHWRLAAAPVYLTMFVWWLLTGRDIVVATLHDEEFDPED